MKREDLVEILRGIGEEKTKQFHQLGVRTIEDLLYYYPRRYEDQSSFYTIASAVDGQKGTFRVKLLTLTENRRVRKRLTITSFAIADRTGEGTMTFFNQPFLRTSLRMGEEYIVYGKIKRFKGRVQLTNPELSILGKKTDLGSIVPIYGLTGKLTNNDVKKATAQVIGHRLFEECLPQSLLEKYRLMGKNEAVDALHRPKSKQEYIRAKQRMVYEELLIFQLAVLQLKIEKTGESGIHFQVHKFDEELNIWIDNLPFQLTAGQQKVLEEVFADMEQSHSIHRLIQGDVGSGKTVVSMVLMYIAVLNGYQATLMAPTEILAKQHWESFQERFSPLGIQVKLLSGSTPTSEKEEILQELKAGNIDILIGTHALIEDRVEFAHLGMNVVDEQHRFGVLQREKLHNKSPGAATIVMSATPIPRTLSLTLYADLDVSTIDTMPLGRKQIQTIGINDSMLERSLEFLRQEMAKGHQIYVICPLIEENENLDNLWSVEEVYDRLREQFSEYSIALLHGKMKNDEKNKIMEAFQRGEVQGIVSTTVIEVGVNVPNATVMFVVNAERFGLAQLHQLRGRVGRGDAQSYCILYNRSTTDISWQRIQVMVDSTDGFYIANKDLELRGFGDIFGTRQSGIPNLRLASPIQDAEILHYAAQDARELLQQDPQLLQPNHLGLRTEVLHFYNQY